MVAYWFLPWFVPAALLNADILVVDACERSLISGVYEQFFESNPCSKMQEFALDVRYLFSQKEIKNLLSEPAFNITDALC